MAAVGFPSPVAKLSTPRPFPSHRGRRGPRNPPIRVRCSAEAAPGTAAEEDTASTTSPPPAPKPFSSLISSSNVEKALRGIPITNADHYGRLGIAKGTTYEGTTYDEVKAAYERKCGELMNKGLDEEEVSKKLELLKESYGILSSEEERRLYDWSLARSENPDRYVWPFEVDITQTPKWPPPPQEPEDEGPTKIVGYVFLAWVILSFVLSVTLNR